jgi:predicted DNA-binding WGR domain protein
MNRDEARAQIIQLSLPQGVLDLFDGEDVHDMLFYDCRRPRYLFDLGDEAVASYAPGRLVPLWESQEVMTVCQLDGDRTRYIQIYLEGGFTDLGSSVQCALANLFITLSEDEDNEHSDLQEAARLLGFEHLDRLLACGRAEDYDVWKAGFLASCAGDPTTDGSARARRFELNDGSTDKFWEIAISGSEHTVRYGRMGTQGQSKTKAFADADTAKKAADKLTASKLKKGYREVSP